jgi:hypothetical protein
MPECNPKKCAECGKTYTPTGRAQRRCPACAGNTVKKKSSKPEEKFPEAREPEAVEQVIEPAGRKDDSEKLRWDLLPVSELEDIIGVLSYGAKKYGDDNWKSVTTPRRRYFAAACRHVFAWWRGETFDPESGLHHLAHAGCSLLFLVWFDKRESKTDA